MEDVGTSSGVNLVNIDIVDEGLPLNAREREGGIGGVGIELLEKPCSPCNGDDGPSERAQSAVEVAVLGIGEGEKACNGVVEGSKIYLESDGEMPRKVIEDEQCDFTGLSPLRTIGADGGGNSSGIDTSGLLDDNRDYDECAYSVPLSSVLASDCSFEDVERDANKEADESCRMSESTTGSKAKLREERFENMKPEKVGDQYFGSESASGSVSECMGQYEGKVRADTHLLERINTSLTGICEKAECEVQVSSSLQGSVCKVASPCFEGSDERSILMIHSSEASVAATDIQGSDVAAVDERTLTCSSNIADCCGKEVNRASAHQKSGTLIVFRRCNPKRAASMKNSQDNMEPDRLIKTKINARKCKEAVQTNASIFTSMLKPLSDCKTKKRSCFRRITRLSVWGAAENLLELFKKNDKVAASDPVPFHIWNENSKRGRSKLGTKRQNKGKRDQRSQVSKKKNPASSDPGYTKGKNCLQTTIPAVAHSQTLLDNCSYGLPDADLHADSGLSKETSEVECKILEDWFNTNLNSSQQKSLHGDKDLESIVTQDASFENLQGDCVGISSRIGSEVMAEGIDCTHSTDPGTSPDSDVFHPTPDTSIINNDGASSASGSSMIDGNSLLKQPNQDSLHAVVMASSETLATPESTSLPDTQLYSDPMEEKKGKTEANGHSPQDSQCCSPEEKFHSSRKLKKAIKPSKSSGHGRKKQGASGRRNSLSSKSIRKSSISGSTGKSSSVEPHILEVPELVCHEEAPNVEIGQERSTLSGQKLANAYSEARHTGALSLIANAQGHKISRGTKAGFRDSSSTHPNSARHRKQNTSRKQKETSRKSKTKSKHVVQSQKHKTSNRGMPSSETADILALTGLTKISKKSDPGSTNITGDVSNTSGAFLGAENSSKTSHHAMENKQALPSQAAWVLCDDCQKWRCISAELADIIDETKCRWTCMDNMDKAFADCSVPQEKTDAQINAELGISDEEERLNVQSISKGVEPSNLAASTRPSWNLIKSNVFLHRNRRTQSIDEIMVCHCKPPSDGRLGCGDSCLNRMLNIECVRGTCPCGDICSNQQFQKRRYSKFECFPCGKKGYGLKVVEDVCQGQFLIEYVGEVLDLAAYEARQRYYASRGQKHFYFMTLNGGEVIDACAKGNLGRFINHSCDPNCRTEKWMVNGEVCIGLFAIRDIKQGEEVTFDYNYVRVFGAAAKKCVCGSSECQGYIGGDPSNAEVIVQCDSDEEYPVPVMVHEDSNESMPDVVGVKVVKHDDACVQHIDGSSMSFPAIPEMGIHQQTEAIPNRSAPDLKPLHSSQNSGPMQSEIIMSRPAADVIQSGGTTQDLSVIQTEETTCRPRVASSKLDKDARENKLDIPEPYPCAKSSHSKVSLKKGRLQMEGLMPQKVKQVPCNGFFEGVEEKLNELLDADGGISKRKDSTKGYLKLLFVTAAEGDNVRGRASQSIRDLSLILDALLKTRSRVVLTDIISKNGLQMLHNIMKQNRNNFNRIPIIRKLLKVLEFLASKGILTPEHMNKGPPCNGMESFRESIFRLTKHNDNQVLQIAREFRDKWIPRSIKSVELSDRDYNTSNAEHAYCNWIEPASFRRRHHGGARDSDAIICVSEGVDLHASSQETCSPEAMSQLTLGQPASSSAPLSDCISMTRIQRRKRKSRWDQPADITNLDQLSVPPNEGFTMEAGSKLMRSTSHEKLRSPIDAKDQHSEANLKELNSLPEHPTNESLMEMNLEDEVPPGFESSCKYNNPQVPSKASEATVEVVMGQLQERYLSHLTVSYGIPLDLLQQFGTYKSEGSRGPPCWAVAPGMPFHPFPPLPPYPRANACAAAPADGDVIHGGSEGAQLAKRSSSSSCGRIISSNTSGEMLAGGVEAGVRYWQTAERGRWHSSSSGRRFFRPHRWNNEKFQRRWQPWPRERNGQRMRGGRSSDGISCTDAAGNTSHIGSGGDFQMVVSSNGFSSSFHQNDNRTEDVI